MPQTSLSCTNWIADGLVGEVRDPKKGLGVYATRHVKAGERVAVWGGDIVTREQLEQRVSDYRIYPLQIDDDLYILPDNTPDVADFFNHSCDPNVGIKGQILVVAMRDIEAGEELCFDYATTDSSDYDEFPCLCGASNCRGVVRGDDWKLPELRVRYKKWFSLYLQRRIALSESGVTERADMKSAIELGVSI